MARRLRVALVVLVIFGVVLAALPSEHARAQNNEDTVPRAVLLELFTSTKCKNCPGADGAANRLAQEFSRASLTIIEWHPASGDFEDEYAPEDESSDEREDFYVGDMGMSYPTAFFDGLEMLEGGSENPEDEETYQEYRENVLARLEKPSPLELDTFGYVKDGIIHLTTKITVVSAPEHSNLYLHHVLYEDHNEWVDGAAGADKYILRYTALRSAERAISLGKVGTVTEYTQTFGIREYWSKEKLGVVTFVQTHDREKPILPPRKNYSAEVLQSHDFRVLAQVEASFVAAHANIGREGAASFSVSLKNVFAESLEVEVSLEKTIPTERWRSQLCAEGQCYAGDAFLTIPAGSSLEMTVELIPRDDAREGETVWERVRITAARFPGAAAVLVFSARLVPAPPKPTITIAARTTNSITVRWAEAAHADFLYYKLYVSTASPFAPSNDTLVATISDRTVTSYVIQGLQSATTYYIILRVANPYGYTDSDVVSGTTKTQPRQRGFQFTGYGVVLALLAVIIFLVVGKYARTRS